MAFLLFICICVICHGYKNLAMETASDTKPTLGSQVIGIGQLYKCELLPNQYFCQCERIHDVRIADVSFTDTAVTQLIVQCYSKVKFSNFSIFDKLPTFIKLVDLSDCFEEEIAMEVLHGLAYIDWLRLQNILSTGNLEWIKEPLDPVRLDPELFSSVPQLKKLTMRWLFMQEFPEALYHETGGCASLQNLEELDLSFNNISNLRPEYFSNMTKLKVLDMTMNEIQNLSYSHLKLQNLEQLKVNFNYIENLNGSPFQHLTKLATLYLHKMRPLKNITLPGFVGQMYPLRGSLQFIHPNSFVGLSNLKILKLYLNSIQLIQNGTFRELERLEQLDLSFGLISRIEEAGFERLQSLIILDLSYNNLSYIGSSLSVNLPKLLYLSLQGNYLKSLPDEMFLNLPDLQGLDVGYNQLNNISKKAFTSSGYLEFLLLSHNHLTTIEDILSELPFTCNKIDVSFNNVSSLDASILPTLAVSGKIVTLNLSHNTMTTVYASNSYFEFFNFNSLFLSLDLRWNRFESIPFNLDKRRFFSMSRIVIDEYDVNRYEAVGYYDDMILQMRDNPIICDCRIYELLQNIEVAEKGVLYANTDFLELTCHSPKNVRGTKLIHLGPSQAWCQKGTSSDCPPSCTCMVQGEQSSTISPWNERVDCSKTDLLNVPSDIPTLTTILHLERNSIAMLHKAAFTGSRMIRKLYLSYNNITKIESNVFSHLTTLQMLYLDGNNVNVITGKEFLSLVNLTELYLNSSRVKTVEGDAFRDLLSLNVLHLENNLLIALPRDIFSTATNLRHLSLTSNRLKCNCDILWFKYWMKNKESILLGSNITCTQRHAQVTILSLSEDSLGCDAAAADRRSRLTIALSVVVVLLSLMMILGIVLYKKKKDLQVYIYARYGWRFKEEEEDMDKPYDAFLSYSKHDLDFIVNELLPGLENREPQFRVCLHHRDFIPGIPIADNILNAVEESRRTIVVISRNFLESDWCQLEFQAAHMQMLQDRATRLIIVLLEDIPADDAPPDIKHYLKTKTYLRWGDERFWERLVYVMPRPRPAQQLVENMEQERLEMIEGQEQLEMLQGQEHLGIEQHERLEIEEQEQ